MKDFRSLPILSLTMAGLIFASTTAKADLISFTLDSPFQITAPGGTVVFDATVTNNSGQVVYLNGDSATLDALLNPSDLSDADYDANFPASLGPGASVDAALFTVMVPVGTLNGIYAGSFEITGGSDGSEQLDLGSANFDVDVAGAVIPEPPSLLLLGSGLAALGGIFRRRATR